MNSRERVQAAINHIEPDRAPFDLGGTGMTQIAASTLHELIVSLGLEKRKVKVSEPYAMYGLIDDDVREYFHVDVVGLPELATKFGYENTTWKPWKLPQNGLEVLIGEGFNTTESEDGTIYAYPQGDLLADPSGKIPKNGYYFDAIIRQEKDFDIFSASAKEDFKDTYTLYDDRYLKYIQKASEVLYKSTEYSLFGSLREAGLGNFANIPSVHLKETKGLRDHEEWLMALLLNKDYIQELFEFQTDIAIKNLELYKQAVGNNIDVIKVGDTDFGTQNGSFFSPDLFAELYKPYFKKMNNWIHENTSWKTFYHSCGSIINFLDHFVEMGVDIINPVQCSATGMDAATLKEKYGDNLTFWGGGINTQSTLPFGTSEEVKSEVKERLRIFSKGGGYVFATIHSIQANTPPQNIVAMYEGYKEFFNQI